MRRIVLACIRLYQIALSPYLAPRCRFVPSCSEYAAQAVARFGVLKGLGLALRRVLRCRPGGAWGYDPVPEKE